MTTFGFDFNVSSNVIAPTFEPNWQHSRFYRVLFNADMRYAKAKMFAKERWAYAPDLRGWFIQVPEVDRLCSYMLRYFAEFNMDGLAVVIDDNPVMRWQIEGLHAALPSVEIEAFTTREDALDWLQRQGYDTDFSLLDNDDQWLVNEPQYQTACDWLQAQVNAEKKGLPPIPAPIY